MKKENYNSTIYASCMGYVIQAIVNNFAPLLFVTFNRIYGISLDKIAILISFNFGIQLLVDLLSSKFLPKIGYRKAVIAADIFAFLGLVGLATLPEALPNPYMGLICSICFYAVGGGVLEVVVSPLVEACPTNKKSATMSLLHSFYCWGHVAVVLLSTAFFAIFGIENWKVLSLLWAVVPVINGVWFLFVPIRTLEEEGGGSTIKSLVTSKAFWVMMLLMVCSGACEQGISQWASAFAEDGLKVSKTFGDLMGSCAFALLMGISRLIYAKGSGKIKLEKFMLLSGGLCLISYLIVAISPVAIINLLGCVICGFSVGIMWPGSYSIASKKIPNGGTTMFALLALAGDLGCTSGPAVLGYFSEAFGSFKVGALFTAVFPLLMIIGLILCKKTKNGERA